MRAVLGGLRWERAVAFVVAVVFMLAVALSVVGALPAQAAKSDSVDTTSQSTQLHVSVEYGSASFSSLGNSWG